MSNKSISQINAAISLLEERRDELKERIKTVDLTGNYMRMDVGKHVQKNLYATEKLLEAYQRLKKPYLVDL